MVYIHTGIQTTIRNKIVNGKTDIVNKRYGEIQ